jgi:hypothetical protein
MRGDDASGRCLCGAVAFTMKFPSKWVAHCHCTVCQHAHGAAFVTWVSADDAQVTVDDRFGYLKWFASSEEAQRGFCSRCGSALFFKSSNWPGELHITRANFTEAADREPQLHGYYNSRVAWFTVNDDLEKDPGPGS